MQFYAFQIVIDENIATLKQSDTVYLLDSSIYIFQAWFGYPDYFQDEQGRSVNAVYGYMKTLLSQLHAIEPTYMVAGFDESLFSGFRHHMYPAYKANRALPDKALAYQLQLCKELTELLGIVCLADPTYEADDWLALAAQAARKANMKSVVITRDKDLAQIVQPGDQWWDWSGKNMRGYDSLQAHWAVLPSQIPDLLALAGDAADNIPGVCGVGDISARALIQHYGSLESLYSYLDGVLVLPIRGAKRLFHVLEDTEDDAFLYRELIRLHPPETKLALSDMKIQPPRTEDVRLYLQDKGLGRAFTNMLSQFYD